MTTPGKEKEKKGRGEALGTEDDMDQGSAELDGKSRLKTLRRCYHTEYTCTENGRRSAIRHFTDLERFVP